jgi:hypothetical protein
MGLLIAYILGLLTPIKRVDPVNQSSQPPEKSDKALPVTSSNLHVESAIQTQPKPNDRKKNGLKIYLAVVHTLTMGAVIWYAIINSHMLDRMNESADAAKRAAQAAEKQLDLSERPWLSVDVTKRGPFANSATGAVLSGSIEVKNIGHTVAKEVNSNVELIVVHGDQIFTKPLQEQKRLCDLARNRKVRPEFTLGPVMFPDAGDRFDFSTQISRKDIDAESFTVPKVTTKFITSVLVGCIDYQTTFSKGHHQTGFIYMITRFDPAKPAVPFLIRADQSLMESQIRFDKWLDGFYAD